MRSGLIVFPGDKLLAPEDMFVTPETLVVFLPDLDQLPASLVLTLDLLAAGMRFIFLARRLLFDHH